MRGAEGLTVLGKLDAGLYREGRGIECLLFNPSGVKSYHWHRGALHNDVVYKVYT